VSETAANAQTETGTQTATTSDVGTYLVRNLDRDQTLATRALLASDSRTRREGLLKRDSLDEGEGLLITPCEAIHTFGMKFSIDVVFLDRTRKVRKVLHAMPRNRVGFCLSGDIALELPAGTAEATGTQVGDQISLARNSPPAP
jgi:uncharacterized protein